MSVTTPGPGLAFAEIKGHDPDNILKALELSVHIAFRTKGVDVDPIEEVHDGTGLLVPDRFVPFGLNTKDDGLTWSRQTEKSEVESHGYASPTRVDIVKDMRSLSITGQETKRSSLELYEGLDLSTTTITDLGAGSGVGSVRYDAPPIPALRDVEVLAIGKDGAGADALYLVRWAPRASMSEYTDQAWMEGTEVRYPVSLDCLVDDTVGTSLRTWVVAPTQRLMDMGFAVAGDGGTPAG